MEFKQTTFLKPLSNVVQNYESKKKKKATKSKSKMLNEETRMYLGNQ